MHKKYHKSHRHKDGSHKRSSRHKHHHKHHKKDQIVSQHVLEPIQEVSKEKVKYDKKACGDYIDLVKTPLNDKEKKAKHRGRRERSMIDANGENVDQLKVDIFAKNYLQKITVCSKDQLVRHHSLEQSGDSLFDRTKRLFRKEKSFNDAVPKASKDSDEIKDNRKDRKRKHHSETNYVEEAKEKNEQRHKHKETSNKGSKEDNKGERRKHKKEKRDQSVNSTNEKSKCARVQEVVYCQLDQAPYKLKNDISEDEIKDLYQRIKREKRREKEGRRSKGRSTHGEDKMDVQSHREDEKINKRSKSSRKKEEEEIIYQKERKSQRRSDNFQSKDRKHENHNDNRHSVYGHFSKQVDSKILIHGKQNTENSSNIDLGPYKKYFAFEDKDSNKHCCKKHHRKDNEGKKSSREKKHREEKEMLVLNMEYEKVEDKKKHEKLEDKKIIRKESKVKTDEDKIHEIVEGDLKTYFSKIQHMLDQKLEAFLQITKSKHKKSSCENLKEKIKNRIRSRSNDKKSEKEKHSKKEEDCKKRDKSKHKNEERKVKTTEKEEIIQEVLKRIKKEAARKSEHKQKCENEICDKHRDKDERKYSKALKLKEQSNCTFDSSQNILGYDQKDLSNLSKKDSLINNSNAITSPDKIYEANNNKDNKSIHRSSERKRRNPPPELVLSVANTSYADWEIKPRSQRKGDNISRRVSKKYNVSATKCDIYPENQPATPLGLLEVVKRSSDNALKHRRDYKYAASDQLHRERCLVDYKRRSSSPERYNTPGGDIVVSRPEDKNTLKKYDNQCYQVFPKSANDSIKRDNDHRCQEPINRKGLRDRNKIDLTNIILPPQTFRAQASELNHQTYYRNPLPSPERQHARQEFLVQGIEPPILECSNRKTVKKTRVRNMECKTVSIVGIPPQIRVPEVPIVGNKPNNSTTPDRDLVEKRKQSKRFKLYYKYSLVNHHQEDKESGFSDVKSIISDSFRVVSNPSEEDSVNICYDSSLRNEREKQVASEVYQVPNLAFKKWNRGDTPRDSHLRNIIEEPSSVSTLTKNGEYFIPIRGTNECYFRPLLSSHSDCCFKINKKPANSNISILSKEACDGRYLYSEDARYRYIKQAKKSKSDFKIIPFSDEINFLRSKSDVFLERNKDKQIIKSIFLENTHSHVKSKRVGPSPNNAIKDPNLITTACKQCQTSELNVNDETIVIEEEKRQQAFETNKQRQFKDIYKTIDNLEENLHSTQKTGPKKCDVAISSTFLYVGRSSDQTQHFKSIYNASDNVEDKIIHSTYRTAVKTVDAAIGSPMSTNVNRSSKTELKKNTHEIAVGISKEQVEKREKNRGYRSESMGYQLKSTGVSPIRIVENIEHTGRSPIRKNITPLSPTPRTHVERFSTARRSSAKPDDSPLRKPVQKLTDGKKGPIALNIHKPKTSLVQDRKAKSPERTLEKKDQKNQPKTAVVLPHVAPPIKVFRSDEKSANTKKRQNTIESRKEDRKSEERTTKSNENQKTEEEPKGPCILVHVSEDSRHVITVSKKVPQASSRTSFRREKSQEKKDVYVKPSTCIHQDHIHSSCLHTYHPKDINVRKSCRHVDKLKTPINPTGKPITVNAAIFDCNPSFHKKVIMVERSTSSSVSGGIYNMRRSKSLVEMRSNRTGIKKSKSEILFCKPSGIEMNDGSVMSGNMEKFTNVPRLRCQSSKSNVNSLDHYIGGKVTSRLFLTKDYKGAEISAYQKRKLYDQSIRQKMKRKFRFSKLNVGPQIFEVHFVSMINSEKEKAAKEQNRFKRPIISLDLEEMNGKNGMDKNKNEETKIKKENSLVYDNKPKTKDDNFDTNERSKNHVVIKENFIEINKNQPIIYNPNQKLENDVISNEYALKKSNTEENDKAVTELYFKDENKYQDKLLNFCKKLLEVNSSLELQEELRGAQCGCNKYSEDCQSCKNFVNLIGVLCSSIASYCDSKNNLVNLKLGVNSDLKEFLNNYSNTDGSHELHIYSPNLEYFDVSNNVQEIYSGNGNALDDSNESTNQSDKLFKNLVDCQSFSTNRTDEAPQVSQPLSCPVLPTNASSFKFLYEESSSDHEGESCEKVLANLTQPCGQTFNFSMSQYNVETPFFQRNSYFSATGSSESGYASIKSKSYKGNSLTSFFKKPNIAALFKPPPKDDVEMCNIYEPRNHDNLKTSVLYKEMTKSCQLYAKKVRENSNMKLTEKSDDYQEFSLSFLMGQDSTVLLQSKMVSRQTSGQTIEIFNGDSESTAQKDETIYNCDLNKETDECPSKGNDSDIFQTTESFFAEKGCKLVLSNECLKVNSITYLGADVFNKDCLKPEPKISKGLELNVKENYDNKNKDDESLFALDFLLESTNPFVPNKDSATQKFFESLIKVYEKEVAICGELFGNDEFLKNVLLPAVEERKCELKKNKKRKFSELFKKKTQVNLSTSDEIKCQGKKCNLDSEISLKLQNLAFNARKCFAMLADAVKVNENIDDELKICGLLKLLERIQCGDFFMIENDESNFKENIKSQIKEAFVNVYEICQKEAKRAKRRVGDQEINLIKLFVGKYKIGLLSKTDIVASYIGRGVIQTEHQLKAAVTYLIHSQSKEVNVRKFEEYCNFTSTVKK